MLLSAMNTISQELIILQLDGFALALLQPGWLLCRRRP